MLGRSVGLARVVAGVVAMGAMAAGCSSSTQSSTDSELTVAWIPKEENNPVFDLGKEGALRAAADLSASTGKKVNLLYMGPQGSNAAEKVASQIDLVHQA